MENSARCQSSCTLEPNFLDPDLFQMLAHSARLQLPEQSLYIPTLAAGCLTFHLQLSCVLRVGHLQPLKTWRSLLYPSPARLPIFRCLCPMIFQSCSLQRRGGLSGGSLLPAPTLQCFSNRVRVAVPP